MGLRPLLKRVQPKAEGKGVWQVKVVLCVFFYIISMNFHFDLFEIFASSFLNISVNNNARFHEKIYLRKWAQEVSIKRLIDV